MINILDVCSSSSVMNIVAFVKLAITIITIAVPIILIVSCMISAFRAMTSGDSDLVNKLFGEWIRKTIAAIIIFFIPNLVFIVISTVTSNEDVKNCYQSASFSSAKQKASSEKSSAEKQIEAWKQEQKKKQEEAKARVQKEREEEKARKQQQKQQTTSYTTSYEPTGSRTTTTSVSKVDMTDLGCPVTYADSVRQYLYFNSSVVNEVHSAMSSWCKNFVSRSPYTNRIETAGAYVQKAGYHGRGLAVDFYNNWTYTENGKKYNPYASQGSATWNRYKTFICEVCNGNENCDKNITYQMYYGYFKQIGWCWGGNWSEGYFDPMHFEKTDGGCSVAPSNRIKC